MTVQGTASTAATSVGIPAHQAGDLILVFTKRNSNIQPTTPAAGGTVPAWAVAQGGAGADALSLISAWHVATAADTTTGAWTNAQNIGVLVLRPDTGKVLGVGPSASGNGALVQFVVYPALTLSTLAGTSWGVRCGTRGGGGADTEMVNPPAGWTLQINVTNQFVVHTRASLTANPTADTVTTTGVDVAYRAHTLEVTEAAMSTQQPMAMII